MHVLGTCNSNGKLRFGLILTKFKTLQSWPSMKLKPATFIINSLHQEVATSPDHDWSEYPAISDQWIILSFKHSTLSKAKIGKEIEKNLNWNPHCCWIEKQRKQLGKTGRFWPPHFGTDGQLPNGTLRLSMLICPAFFSYFYHPAATSW